MEEPAAAAANTISVTNIASSGLSGFPDWVLLDTASHIGHCNNATTAKSTTSAQSPITVSLEVVDPPRLSHCVVHCPDLNLGAPPLVIGADGAFLLIIVYYSLRDGKQMSPDVFVYRADPRAPSLLRLPQPYPLLLFIKSAIGVLASGDRDDSNKQYCSVVIPERNLGGMSYDLHVFCTKRMSWSSKATRLAPDVSWYGSGLNQHEPTKVFSIGGGSLAWVDLLLGILLCNVLDEEPEIQVIPLPQLMPSNEANYGVTLDGLQPPLYPIRDVSFRRDGFRFVELEYPYDTNVRDITQLNFRWKITLFKTSVSSAGRWDRCHTVASSDLLCSDSSFFELFPEIWEHEENRTILSKKVMNQGPILDMYHDDTVYMISKLDAHEPNGWLFAVDTKASKLEKVVPVYAETVYSQHTYMQCAFSKYLNKEEKHSTQDNGLLTSPLVDVQELVEYDSRGGQNKALNDIAIICLRALKEIDLLLGECSHDPSAIDEATRDKISLVQRAIHNLTSIYGPREETTEMFGS